MDYKKYIGGYVDPENSFDHSSIDNDEVDKCASNMLDYLNESSIIPDFESDKDLYNYMRRNISYKNFTKLMPPEEVYKEKKGSCHDQVMFEMYCLRKMKYSPKSIFLIEYNDTGEGRDNVTHSFVYYERNNKVYWFENAWGGQEGIHEFKSLKDIKEKISKLHEDGKFGNYKKYPKIEFTSFKSHKPGESLQQLVDIALNESYIEEFELPKRPDEQKVSKEIFDTVKPIILTSQNKSKASKLGLDLKCEITEVDSGMVFILVLDGPQDKRDTEEARSLLKDLASKCKSKLSDIVSKVDIGDGDEGCLFFTMDKGKIRKKRKDLLESYIEEGYFKSTDNLEFNLDKWSRSGNHNIFYITGISGSGKSTLAKKMCKEYNAEYIELDKFTLGMVKGLDRWFENVDNGTYEVHPLLKEYFSQIDHLTTNGSWSKPDMGDEHTKFITWLINKIKGNGTLYIVEGAQFFMRLSNMDPDLIKGEPLIVVGTSAFKSWIRRIKRDTANDETISRFIYHLKKDVPMLFKYYFSNEKDLQKYIKNMQSNINESYLLQEASSNKVYHLSQTNLDGKTIQPTVPSNYMTVNGYEDGKTKRVCFATSIDGCLRGLSLKCEGMKLFVHVPDGNYNIYKPSNKEVPDASITGEVWIKKAVKMKCIGQIYVIGDKGEDGIPYKYGDKTAELYDWEWKWIDKFNESSSILPQNTEITTVIFDLGDVLVSANIKDYLVADPEVPNEIVDELFKHWFIDKDEVDDTMDLDTYREIVNKRMGVEFSKYIPKLFQYNVDCVNAFDYTIPIIQDLKDKGYKVYYLSNWPAWTHDLLQEAGKFDFLKLMDGGVFSYDVGYMKPDEEIYKILINKYKINPEEAVFFDDREENIEAANKLGIHGVHFPRHDSSIVYNNLYGRKLAKAICEELCEKYNVKLKEFDKSKFKDRAESLRKSVSILKQEISKYPILKKGKIFDYSKSIPKDFKNEYYEFINGQHDSISLYNINLWDIGMKVSPRSDEGQQYADENIFGPIKDEVMKKVSDRLPKGYSLDTGGDWDSLYITLVHKVSSNESLIEEEIENEFSPTSFVKRSSLPAKNQKNHARYLRKKAHSNKTNNATTQNELPKYNQIGELYVEEVAKSVQIKPIFIVTSYTNTPFGKAIKTFTHSEYTHAAISFDTSLEKLYSFNADSKYSNNGYKGGISRESLSSYIDSYEKTIIQVNCIFLKPSDFDIVQRALDNLLENEEKTKYAYSNIINILIGRAKDTGMAMVCSQFVAYILHTANIELLDKPDNTVTPKDLSTITNPRVYKIFEGYAKDYEKKRIDRIFRKLKTKALLIKESLLKLCV